MRRQITNIAWNGMMLHCYTLTLRTTYPHLYATALCYGVMLNICTNVWEGPTFTPKGDRDTHLVSYLWEVQFVKTFFWSIFRYNRYFLQHLALK